MQYFSVLYMNKVHKTVLPIQYVIIWLNLFVMGSSIYFRNLIKWHELHITTQNDLWTEGLKAWKKIQ